MQNHHFLYWGYSFHQERDFKALRAKRSAFMDELRKDAREAGLIE
jgi:hypothetical protein